VQHFQQLFARYGNKTQHSSPPSSKGCNVVLLNLVKEEEKTPRESTLGTQFINAIHFINNSLTNKLSSHNSDTSKLSSQPGDHGRLNLLDLSEGQDSSDLGSKPLPRIIYIPFDIKKAHKRWYSQTTATISDMLFIVVAKAGILFPLPKKLRTSVSLIIPPSFTTHQQQQQQ
jgi:hypothetical protein